MSDPGLDPAAPCIPWELDASCCNCDEWEHYEQSTKDRAAALAWSTMATLSGGRIGRCPVIMRPCLGPPCSECVPGGAWMTPFIRDGNWFNRACGIDPCSCERLCEIVMPGPIAAVLRVQLDGVDIPLDNFRVDNGNRLVRQDGSCWPSCQNMNAKLGEPGTLGIEYVPGIRPDINALYAAGTLACEYAKACTGKKCRLPSGVQTIARQGVTFTVGVGMFPNNQSGLTDVDAYITAINPNGLRTPSMVWSPDLPAARHRYTTWTGPVPAP